MGISMLVSLYTSRIILDVLGITDYGIYNIVGGVVVMFSFFNNILTVAIRRFLAVEIASGNILRVNIIFKACIRSVMLIAILVFFVLETVGLWFVNSELNIPMDRLAAANWAFQFSLFSFILNLNALPYNAAIVTYEKMNMYAYLGILEIFLRLGMIISIKHVTGYDNLILYALGIFLIVNIIRMLNVIYCKKRILKVPSNTEVDRTTIKLIFSYSAWALLGALFFIFATQGVNIIMNFYYGVALNAAIGLSQQIANAVNQFGGNFQTAFNPQLTKSYAATGMSKDTYDFTIRTSKMSVILMLMICVPLISNMQEILNLWLNEVPLYTAPLCNIALIYVFFEVLSGPLYILIYAKGDVKTYSIVLSVIQIIYVIAVFSVCISGASPVNALSMNVICAIALFVGRLIMAHKILGFGISRYLYTTFLKILPVLIILAVAQHFISMYISYISFFYVVLKCFIIEIFLLISVVFFYTNNEERKFVLKTLKIKK